MPTSDYSLDDVTATVLSTVGPGFTTETDLVKKKQKKTYLLLTSNDPIFLV